MREEQRVLVAEFLHLLKGSGAVVAAPLAGRNDRARRVTALEVVGPVTCVANHHLGVALGFATLRARLACSIVGVSGAVVPQGLHPGRAPCVRRQNVAAGGAHVEGTANAKWPETADKPSEKRCKKSAPRCASGGLATGSSSRVRCRER